MGRIAKTLINCRKLIVIMKLELAFALAMCFALSGCLDIESQQPAITRGVIVPNIVNGYYAINKNDIYYVKEVGASEYLLEDGEKSIPLRAHLIKRGLWMVQFQIAKEYKYALLRAESDGVSYLLSIDSGLSCSPDLQKKLSVLVGYLRDCEFSKPDAAELAAALVQLSPSVLPAAGERVLNAGGWETSRWSRLSDRAGRLLMQQQAIEKRERELREAEKAGKP